MSSHTHRMLRCKTELSRHCDSSLRSKHLSTEPTREPLSKQSRFVNPYSKAKPEKKQLLRFQQPHSIVLLPKRYERMVSQIKMNTFVQPSEEQQKYTLDKIIGKGLRSIVFLGFHQQSNQRVAIKKLPQDPRMRSREEELLSRLEHPNIVRLIDSYYTTEHYRRYQCLVMRYYPCDLHHLVQKRKRLPEKSIRTYAFQILKGLDYLHCNSIVHRDLKSSNILISKEEQIAVIADLGAAREVSFGEAASGQPCPFSYRAPQLIFGTNNYTQSADMWAFACILLEMTGELPFKARSNTELTIQIISMLGNPSLQQIFEINPNYDLKEYEKLPKVKGKGKILHENQLLNDLLQKILVYSPERRLTAAEALQHEYFQEGRFPELRSDSPESPEVQRDIFATPFHKRDDSNLKTVASLEDETYRTNNSKAKSRVQLDSSRARKESLKMRLEKAGLSSKLVRKLPF